MCALEGLEWTNSLRQAIAELKALQLERLALNGFYRTVCSRAVGFFRRRQAAAASGDLGEEDSFEDTEATKSPFWREVPDQAVRGSRLLG